MPNSITVACQKQAKRVDFVRRNAKHWRPEQHFRDEVLRLFKENFIFDAIPGNPLYKGIKAKYMTGKRFFIRADHDRRLLIGSLGWFSTPEHPMGHPQMLKTSEKIKFSALWKIQEIIGNACLKEGLYWRIIVDPQFAVDPEFEWLWYTRSEKPEIETTSPPEATAAQLVVRVPYYLTRPPFPLQPHDAETPYIRELGEGKEYKVEAALQRIYSKEDSESEDLIRRMPYGVMPNHILDTLYGIYRATDSPLIVFGSAQEVMDVFGYQNCQKNRDRVRLTLWDIYNTRIDFQQPLYQRGLNISPFAGCGLWDQIPAITDKRGRRRAGQQTKDGYLHSFILLSPTFLSWCKGQGRYPLDWALSNQLKDKEKMWCWYRKALELGQRNNAKIPLRSATGLLVEFGYRVEGAAYRKSKHRFQELLQNFRDLTMKRYGIARACPHFVQGDMLVTRTWQDPLDHNHLPESRYPVPAATSSFIQKGIDPHEFMLRRSEAISERRRRLGLAEVRLN